MQLAHPDLSEQEPMQLAHPDLGKQKPMCLVHLDPEISFFRSALRKCHTETHLHTQKEPDPHPSEVQKTAPQFLQMCWGALLQGFLPS